MTPHQVAPFANGLSSKLASRSRHVCLFLGAGASCSCGLPDVSTLSEKVVAGLEGDQKAAFERQLEGTQLRAGVEPPTSDSRLARRWYG